MIYQPGSFSDGKFNGDGIMKAADGSVIFEGEWKDGVAGNKKAIGKQLNNMHRKPYLALPC